jgi:hypothetical protein
MDERYDSGPDGQSPGVWPLYVALFLVLLSFFTMLTGSSKIDAAKTSAVVVDGLRPTFRAQPARLRSDDGVFWESSATLDGLGGEVAGLLRMARVERPGRGAELRVTFPASELYPAKSAELRDESTRLIDRVVAAFGASPPGNPLKVTFSLGRPGGDDASELAFVVSRVDAFARALVARGAPPADVAIGIDAHPSERASLAFRQVVGPAR